MSISSANLPSSLRDLRAVRGGRGDAVRRGSGGSTTVFGGGEGGLREGPASCSFASAVAVMFVLSDTLSGAFSDIFSIRAYKRGGAELGQVVVGRNDKQTFCTGALYKCGDWRLLRELSSICRLAVSSRPGPCCSVISRVPPPTVGLVRLLEWRSRAGPPRGTS
jgi:hypothetical protein